jgi:hypothetical protein
MHKVCADSDPSKPLSDVLLSKTFERAAQTFPWIANYKDRSITELEVPLPASRQFLTRELMCVALMAQFRSVMRC